VTTGTRTCPDYITQLCNPTNTTSINNCEIDCDYGKYYYNVTATKDAIRAYITGLEPKTIIRGNGTQAQLTKGSYILWIEPNFTEIAELQAIFSNEKRSANLQQMIVSEKQDEASWWNYRRHNTISSYCNNPKFKANFKKFFKMNGSYISIWKIESSKIDTIKMIIRNENDPSSNNYPVDILCFRPSILTPPVSNVTQCDYIPFIPLCFAGGPQQTLTDMKILLPVSSPEIMPIERYKTLMTNPRVDGATSDSDFSEKFYGVGNDKLLTGEYYVFNAATFESINQRFSLA
jgi:hypothetical protein